MQLKHLVLTMVFQRTVTTPLNLCLSPGVHFTPMLCSILIKLIVVEASLSVSGDMKSVPVLGV